MRSLVTTAALAASLFALAAPAGAAAQSKDCKAYQLAPGSAIALSGPFDGWLSVCANGGADIAAELRPFSDLKVASRAFPVKSGTCFVAKGAEHYAWYVNNAGSKPAAILYCWTFPK